MSEVSKLFPLKKLTFGATLREETVIVGARDFALAAAAFKTAGVKEILVIGYKSQGQAQPKDIRDALREAGYDGVVRIGLRPMSDSAKIAEADGFEVVDLDVGIETADLVISLIADSGQVDQYYKGLFNRMKPGATLGFSHGFLAKYLDDRGLKFPSHINVIGVCPKAVGGSVRSLFERGSGSNVSIAVEQDVTGNAALIAAAWAVSLGAPFAFETTLLMEAKSDIVGERFILLGAVWAIVTKIYQRYVSSGMSEDDAYRAAVLSLTGPIRKTLSDHGLDGLYKNLSEDDQTVFRQAYDSAYGPFRSTMEELYEEVASGREIERVLAAGKQKRPLHDIGLTRMWSVVGKRVRASRDTSPEIQIDPFVAGIYVAGMMAQVDTLLAHGHKDTEVVNESIIEALDSLLFYMDRGGVDSMVDGCSDTARYGARDCGPKVMEIIEDVIFVAYDGLSKEPPQDYFQHFLGHEVHGSLATCMKLRPPISLFD